MSEKYTVEIIDIDGELGFEIPEEIVKELNLKPDDKVKYELKEDGSVYFSKVED